MKQLIVIVIFCLNSVLSMGQKAEIFSPGGVAIMGYDPVAFFKQSKAVMGTDVFSYRWKDAEWHFSNEETVPTLKLPLKNMHHNTEGIVRMEPQGDIKLQLNPVPGQ